MVAAVARVSVLERRVEALEAAGGDGGGCDRCRGLRVTVRNCISGELRSARWNGEALSAEELAERETEKRCPRCGRDLSGDKPPVIKVGKPI